MKEFNNLEEMQPYYNAKTNTYEFDCDVQFNFNVNVRANIIALNIIALNINALNIKTLNINALNINALNIKTLNITVLNITARDINYYAICLAYKNINCTSIKGRRNNAKHFALDGKITIKPKTYKIKIDDKEIELSEESYNNFKRQFKEE